MMVRSPGIHSDRTEENSYERSTWRCAMRSNSRRLTQCLVMAVLFVPTLHTAVHADYQVVDVSDGGTIKGVVIWKGEIPRIPPLVVKADMDTCGETAPSPVLKVDPKSKGVPSTLIYLEQVEKGKAPAD